MSNSSSEPESSQASADGIPTSVDHRENPKWFGSDKVQPDSDDDSAYRRSRRSRSRSTSTQRSKSSLRSHKSEYSHRSVNERSRSNSTQRSKSTRGSHKRSDHCRSSRSRSTSTQRSRSCSTQRSKSTVGSKSTISWRDSRRADDDDDGDDSSYCHEERSRSCSTQRSKSTVESLRSKSTISWGHSADISSSKSPSAYRRHVSAPDISGDDRSAYSYEYRRGSSTDERSRPSSILKETQHQRQHKERGRSLTKSDSKDLRTFSSTRQSRSRSKSLLSRLSRGRSKEKTGQTGISDVIVSAGRSFSRSISRCNSSLSRNAFKIPKCASKMDNHEDAELFTQTQRYSVPFNPSTGRCLYHPDVIMALKNERGKGGWRFVSDGCPKCHLDQL